MPRTFCGIPRRLDTESARAFWARVDAAAEAVARINGGQTMGTQQTFPGRADAEKTFQGFVRAETERTWAKHEPYQNAHTAYGVLLEEVDEFWQEVKKKREHRDKRTMLAELVQVAAVAQRAAVCLGLCS